MPHENTQNIFYLSQTFDSFDSSKVDSFLDELSTKGTNVVRTGKTVPTGDNVLVFKGVVSQNYGVGESSRNKYKYDQTGWIFTDYNYNPVIAWQHDYSYGTIGNAVSFWLDEEKNLNSLFYVDLEALEPRHAKQVKSGLVRGISTGASTVEYMFEDNKTGERMTEDDAEEKFGWENVFRAFLWGSDFITLVITKAKLLENSLVTIGSNEKAIAMQNSLSNSFARKAEEYKNLKSGSNPANSLSSNSSIMDKPEIKGNDTEGTAASPVETPAPTEGTDTPAGGVEGASNNAVNTDTVESLQNKILEIEKNHAGELQKLKDDYEAKLTSEVNKIREEERANLARVVATNGSTTPSSNVKTKDDLRQKYIKK